MAVVEKIADEMRAAFGPKGQNIIVRNSDGSVLRTRDGITIAREFKFEDPLENMAAQLLKDAAEGTRKMTGDGAKTTVFLVHSLLSQAVAAIKAGAKPIAIRAGIQAAVTAICGSVDSTAGRTPGTLDRQAKQLRGSEVVTNVGTISANNEKKIGILVSEAMKKVGRDGVIIVMESKTLETTLQVVEGLQFDRGYISPHFITDSKEKQCVLDAAHILIHEKPISSMKDLLPLLEQIAKLGRPLLIIAEDVNGEALATLIVNKLRETLQCAAVRAPGFGDRRKAMLEDLAILTGAKAITEEIGIKLENVKIEDLGRAKKIFIDENSCTIVEGYGKNSEIEGRILRLRREIEMTTGDYDRQKLQERLDKLVSGVAIINVAAGSEFEKERRESLVREAICAVRCASEEGVVAGGGGALPRAARDLGALHDGEEQRKGVDIVRSACDVVLLQLAANNLKNGELLIDEVLKNPTAEYGFSATHDKCMNLMEVGIIEPVAVPRVALRNAASVAIEILSSRKFSAAI
jgi:chaperonin GroEL